ncbi:hypothetical protein F5Y17DRAFT_317881 [Xylariaceae sp. FL0594]|nr:hypothetical protein F5Y17DRAFT_317881 [Xylariaceae sp. FL0594]
MSSDEHKGQVDSFEYGASVTREVVDFSPDSGIESAGVRDRALMDKLREALRPGDAKKKYGRSGSGSNRKGGSGGPGSSSSGGGGSGSGIVDTTHDGRHGGIEATMKPGNRDYDEREETMSRGGVLDALGDSKHEGRKGSILDNIHLGSRQHGYRQSKRPQEGTCARPQEGSGGGGALMKEKTGKSVQHIESYRDSTDSKHVDAGRMPGTYYSSIRDDAFK